MPYGTENMPPDVLYSRKCNGVSSLLPNTRPFLGCHHGCVCVCLCVCVWVCVLVAQSCLTLCDPMDCSLLGSSVHGIILCPWNYPGRNIGVGCHFLLQGIFLTQGSNPGLLHCRQILYCLIQAHHGKPSKSLATEANI